ncbi:MAG: hypothetical protein EXS14_03680 [Planctomycetes bacterium]|nr:hypothetical protein [Planctomycetota bacterium]
MNRTSMGYGTAPRAIALLMLFLLALLTLHRRNESLRGSYAARKLLEREARLQNEVRWLGASAEAALSPRGLLQRVGKLGRSAKDFNGTIERVTLPQGPQGPLGN